VGGIWVPQVGVRTSDNGLYPAVSDLVTPSTGLWTLAGFADLLAVDPPGASGVPRTVELAQNAPNPFARTTSIRYGVPRRASVSLVVYSVSGERVATLAQGVQEPGYHVADFVPARMPGGTYFYRLQVDGVTQSRKLVLLR